MRRRLEPLLLAALLLAGCSKVTAENYERLQTGMTRAEVHAILGSPDEVSGGGLGTLTIATDTWHGPRQQVQATFIADKLTVKAIAAP